MSKFCPECNTENEDTVKFCRKCGTPLNSAPKIENKEINNSSSNILKIVIVAILCFIIIGGALILLNDDSDDSDDSIGSEDEGLKIISGSISTGSDMSDKTYCSVYVGEEYSGEDVKIRVKYSAGDNDLNKGKIIPKTVDDEGYVSVASEDAFEQYPDFASITIFDSDGNRLDSEYVNLESKSGSQPF